MISVERNRLSRSAADPWLDGRPPHLPSDGARLPGVFLLPGDPARVTMIGAALDEFDVLGSRREFTLGVGRINGVELGVCSTGIGGPSTEIAVVELRRLGVHTFIRVGGMGASEASLAPGTLTRVSRALREGGAARFYDTSTDPIHAEDDVTEALKAAAADLEESLTPITVLSCDSYYVGEGRSLPGLEVAARSRLKRVVASDADAMDMECETVFVVGRALGARVGALLATHGNRATDEWLEDFEPVQQRLIRIALKAAKALSP